MSTFSFRLPEAFIAGYVDRPVPWGFPDAAGNSFGELIFLDKYSAVKEDGAKETWVDVCRRVTEGTYTIQRDWAHTHRLPWSDEKATESAMEFFERLFELKWSPPGRGLAQMGRPLVMDLRNSAPLQNCAYVGTSDMASDPVRPFLFLMEASMLGVGVGFDTKGADLGLMIQHGAGPEAGVPSLHMRDNGRAFPPSVPSYNQVHVFQIPDTREGWVEATGRVLRAFLEPGSDAYPVFDFSLIRAEGEPIKTFGGTAAGPEPLHELLTSLVRLLGFRGESRLTSTDIVDIANLIGKCVVSGNVRRSAELAMGSPDDKDFINLKNPDINPERMAYPTGWGQLSNNSLDVVVGQDYTPFVDAIALNGEPGLIWMDVSRAYGRLADQPNNVDHRAMGYNPCAEQTLESYEMCTLVENYPTRCTDVEDFLRTLKFSYLYAKTVTLMPTHWEETNAIMQRNRRIGNSCSGLATFADRHGTTKLRNWLNLGYETINRYDRVYSEWLCVRESIKKTSIKPSGTVSLVTGVTPGVHWSPGGEHFLRSVRFAKNNPLVPKLREAGYTIEQDNYDLNGLVVYFPIRSDAARSQTEVSMWEKTMLAVLCQREWADNSVSVTVTFDPDREGAQIAALLHAVEGQLKTVSFLPNSDTTGYTQLPYTPITAAEYESFVGKLAPVDFSVLYEPQFAEEAKPDRFCDGDTCVVAA